jgi:hypothetical protein
MALAAGLTVSACSTTMDEAAREQLNSARIRTSQRPTRVTAAGRLARVERVSTVAAGAQTAYIVTVRNVAGRQISDLPISVGYRRVHRVYANVISTQEFSYFDAHLPVIAPESTVTWVYTSDQRLPRGARPFAVIGGAPAPAAPVASPLPVIRARLLRGPIAGTAATGAAPARLALENLSSVPQFQLQVYAYARSGGRYVAAGNVTVPHLDGQGSMTVSVPLAGRASGDQLQVEAVPTIVK